MAGDGEGAARSSTPGARSREPIAPIFRHLPRGPNNLDPREIAVHQRARINGAMVEVVAHGGYERITVRRVIGLAGVSRRSFYELFENRHDCFLKTVEATCEGELMRARDGRAHASPRGEALLASALARLADDVHRRPDSLRLALCDSLSAGDEGAATLGRALATCEQMLGEALAATPRAQLPAGILRALTGGLHGMLAAALRGPEIVDGEALAAAMARFALAQRLPRRVAAAEELATCLRDRGRRAAVAAASRPAAREQPGDPRELMLRSALRLAARRSLASLNGPEIADGAGVPVDAFLDTFHSPGECVAEALERAGEELLAITRRARDAAADWPQTLRLALAGALGHLAANPGQAAALALVVHRADASVRMQSRELDAALGAALLEGAPASSPASEAATGALWHIVRQALLEQRTPMLPAISDHLAYALLAPALGAEAALGALRGRG
jgi:AcrR family transcriptional regulator